ncbi:accessory Sec system protein Asp2, partial [Aeromonas sp. HMWF014]|uniref:accessory Sec system protein Asp2 n=1 Tax=Aeromonas sp. HMWF014 TaxID=2056850 RepID=UPI000D45C2BD
MNIQSFSFESCQVEYIFKSAKKDYKHLLIVFSGHPEKAKYDFQGGASEHYNGNILWIRDACTLSGICNYYMMSDNQYVVESAVVALINAKINFLNINSDDVTLIGFSKGGSAALYFGVKYGFKNIISTVPQMKIGSYVHRYHKSVATEMLGDKYSIYDIDKLDSILSDLIISDMS